MNNLIRTVIVDDELGAQNALRSIITRTAPELDIVGSASDVQSAYELITETKPKLVFLDIQLKNQTGFDLLQMQFELTFEVIFVTAYDEYAIQAFQVNALSYLLKPISIQAFQKVKSRALQILSTDNELSSGIASSILGGKIAIPNGSAVDYLTSDEIIYIKADGSYSEILLNNKKKILLSKGLSYLSARLSNEVFIRPHRSYLVNVTFIKRWSKADGGFLILTNNDEIPISRGGRSEVERFFDHS